MSHSKTILTVLLGFFLSLACQSEDKSTPKSLAFEKEDRSYILYRDQQTMVFLVCKGKLSSENLEEQIESCESEIEFKKSLSDVTTEVTRVASITQVPGLSKDIEKQIIKLGTELSKIAPEIEELKNTIVMFKEIAGDNPDSPLIEQITELETQLAQFENTYGEINNTILELRQLDENDLRDMDLMKTIGEVNKEITQTNQIAANLISMIFNSSKHFVLDSDDNKHRSLKWVILLAYRLDVISLCDGDTNVKLCEYLWFSNGSSFPTEPFCHPKSKSYHDTVLLLMESLQVLHCSDLRAKIKATDTLDLSNKGISHLDATVMSYFNLDELDLSHNNLVDITFFNEMNHSNLELVNLSNNQISELPEGPNERLDLDMSNNKLEYLESFGLDGINGDFNADGNPIKACYVEFDPDVKAFIWEEGLVVWWADAVIAWCDWNGFVNNDELEEWAKDKGGSTYNL